MSLIRSTWCSKGRVTCQGSRGQGAGHVTATRKCVPGSILGRWPNEPQCQHLGRLGSYHVGGRGGSRASPHRTPQPRTSHPPSGSRDR